MNSSRPKKITVRCYDYDNCLAHGVSTFDVEKHNKIVSPARHKNPEDLKASEEWLLSLNIGFLNKEISEIKAGGYDEVILCYFTARSSLSIDIQASRHPYHAHASCIPAIPMLQSFFSSRLTCKVVMDTFLMADIYGNPENGGDKLAGESYKQALKEFLKDPDFSAYKEIFPFTQAVYDGSKVLMAYAIAHRTATLNFGATIDISIADDSLEIHRDLAEGLAPSSLPKCKIFIKAYDGSDSGKVVKTIIGTGSIDHLYDWSVRSLATGIQEAGPLKLAHQNNQYDFQKVFRYDLRIKEFTAFRQTPLAEFKSTLGDGGYTTANDLSAEGLLHDKYLKSVNEFKDFSQTILMTSPGINSPIYSASPSSQVEEESPTKSEKVKPPASCCLIS